MTRYLDVDEVLDVYRRAIGEPVIRNSDGLASAVARPQQSAFGEDAYPTLVLKAAALMQSLAENQPFLDGNKRIAWICGKLFVQLNGYSLKTLDVDANALFRHQIARGMTVIDLADWIAKHLEPYIY